MLLVPFALLDPRFTPDASVSDRPRLAHHAPPDPDSCLGRQRHRRVLGGWMIGGGVAAAAGGMALGYSVVDEANKANGDNSIVAEFGGAVFMYAAAIAGTGLSAWGAAELHRGRVSRCDGLPGLSGPPGSEPDDIPEREPPDDE